LSLPLSVYRIAQAMLDEAAARLALIAAAFWPLLIYFSASPMPDALAAYTLFAALALLSGPPTYLSSLSFGALAGLTFALRFQIAPMLGPAILIAVWCSVVTNVELNLFAHVSDVFGTEPAYFYLVILAISSAGLAYFGAFGLALSWRNTWPLWLMGLIQLAALSAVSHKEPIQEVEIHEQRLGLVSAHSASARSLG
jgi:hypothetical protein